jgi:transcriptional regulator with XRE-family HTH domain
MTCIREIFAKNIKENRHKCGFSQEKLAERAAISTHYLAMIELARNFPSSDIIERIADALGIEIYELFVVAYSPAEELDKLHQEIITDIKQIVQETIENSFEKREKREIKRKETKTQNLN